LIIFWLGLLLTATACSLVTSGPDVVSATNTADLQSTVAVQNAEASSIATAAQPYRGTVIRGISENTPPSFYIQEVLAPAFEEETGIKIELKLAPWDEVANATAQDIEAGTASYDFVYVEQDFVYTYLEQEFIVNLSQTLADNPQLALPNFNLTNFTSFVEEFKDPSSGDLYGVPIEAFVKVYIYRKDLFEDPQIQAAFLEEFNYPLAPAVTLDQYRDNAAFFTRYGQEHNLELWGTTAQAAIGHPASFYEFFETIAPGFGLYNWGINPNSYRATVATGGELNSNLAKRALVYWLELLNYAPPESIRSDWNDVATTFAQGRAAQGLVYGENVAWLATDPNRSTVVGNVGVALPPTAPGAIEDTLVGKGYLGYYDGAAFGMLHTSKHKEATLLWLQYLGLPEVQPEWAVTSSRVVHLSTFDDPLVKAQDRQLSGYYTLMKKQGRLFAGAPPFPFHATIREVIASYLYQAIAKELTPAEALDQAAVAVDAELARLGYNR